jgi:hypothetical protein
VWTLKEPRNDDGSELSSFQALDALDLGNELALEW